MRIRAAHEADLPAVAAIHDREVHSGVATFDLEPRPMATWAERLAVREPGTHLLVAEEGDAVLGYASSQPYRPKSGYRHTRETTVYVDPAAQGQGLGRELYDDLLRWLTADGMHLALAAIALPNPASEALHRACGFEPVGTMRQVGRKFDRWIDVQWWQRML